MWEIVCMWVFDLLLFIFEYYLSNAVYTRNNRLTHYLESTLLGYKANALCRI